MKQHFFVILVLLTTCLLWLDANGQSGRRKPPQAEPTPAATPDPVLPDAPVRGAGTPVWVAFAAEQAGTTGEVKPKSAQLLAERVADWLFQYGGLKVGRLPKPLAPAEAQELARKLTAGYLVLVQLGEVVAPQKGANCGDPCNPKCLRFVAFYPAHLYLFSAGSGAPQLDREVVALFDPALFQPPPNCPSRPPERRRPQNIPPGAAVCFNGLPTELTPDALECLARRTGDFVNREIKGPDKQ